MATEVGLTIAFGGPGIRPGAPSAAARFLETLARTLEGRGYRVVFDDRPADVRVFWDLDPTGDPDPGARAYDLVLTRGGDDSVIEAYEAAGARVCHVIHDALDAATLGPAPVEERFKSDLSLHGDGDAMLVQAAELAPTCRFLVAGSNGNTPPNVRRIEPPSLAEQSSFYRSARALLVPAASPPERLFETAGVGACVIAAPDAGAERFLVPGEEVLIAADGAEIASHLYALDEKRAREIGAAARQRICDEHTFSDRADEIERILDGLFAASPYRSST